MNVFSSPTIWIVLATIIPGLVFIACLFIIMNWVSPGYRVEYSILNNWFGFSIAVGMMTVNQTLGIFLQPLIIKTMPSTFNGVKLDSSIKKTIKIRAKDEFDGLYFVLSSLRDEDDRHGHIQRIIGQFFLTLNSLVAFLLSFLVNNLLAIITLSYNSRVIAFTIVMLILLFVTFYALKKRYQSMIESLWTIRNRIKKKECNLE